LADIQPSIQRTITKIADKTLAFPVSDIREHHKRAFTDKRACYALSDACCGSRNQSDKSL
jgi:hypothetical protein